MGRMSRKSVLASKWNQISQQRRTLQLEACRISKKTQANLGGSKNNWVYDVSLLSSRPVEIEDLLIQKSIPNEPGSDRAVFFRLRSLWFCDITYCRSSTEILKIRKESWKCTMTLRGRPFSHYINSTKSWWKNRKTNGDLWILRSSFEASLTKHHFPSFI